ncbi:MAG: hypothetical protein U0031_05870 [Thermomicrobiales bacterium]
MDGSHFDAFVKAVGQHAPRRAIVRGLLGGGLTSLLTVIASAARHGAGRHAVSANKPKKPKKHKKHKKSRPPRDDAPPCVDGACPLPPGCAQPAVADCAAAFIAATQIDLAGCQSACAEADSPGCQACLDPIVRAHLPAAHTCIAAGCAFSLAWTDPASRGSATRHRAWSPSGRAGDRAWWERVCAKPTCCFSNLETCGESARDTLVKCGVGALVAAGRGGPAAGIGAAVLCLGNYAYDTGACLARFGCRDGECVAGDRCVCPAGGTQCGAQCCHVDQTCCGGQCCPENPFEGEHYCCGDATRGKCCSRFASDCHAGRASDPPVCCFPGDTACHGTCCVGQQKCCDDGTCVALDACCPDDPTCCASGGRRLDGSGTPTTCCPAGEAACPAGGCCSAGQHCCPTGGCCHDGDTCCFRESSQTKFCCPPGAQCMQTGLPCCSNC